MDKIPHLLIVEDNEDHYQLIQDALTDAQCGYHHEWIRDGEALMQRLQEEALPSLILLDLNLPRRDGRETLKDIKNTKRLRRIPVVVLTTSRSRDDINLCYQLGVNAFLRKPAGYEELVSLLQSFAHFWLKCVEFPIDLK